MRLKNVHLLKIVRANTYTLLSDTEPSIHKFFDLVEKLCINISTANYCDCEKKLCPKCNRQKQQSDMALRVRVILRNIRPIIE